MSLINYLETIDQKIILLLNGNNILFLDKIMWMLTQPVFGLPFYILFIYLFFKKYNFKNALKIILVIGFAVGLGDFIAHELIKETVQRYRPSHHIQISNQLNYFLMSNGTFYIGGKIKWNPAVKSEKDRKALIDACNKNIIDVIAYCGFL